MFKKLFKTHVRFQTEGEGSGAPTTPPELKAILDNQKAFEAKLLESSEQNKKLAESLQLLAEGLNKQKNQKIDSSASDFGLDVDSMSSVSMVDSAIDLVKRKIEKGELESDEAQDLIVDLKTRKTFLKEKSKEDAARQQEAVTRQAEAAKGAMAARLREIAKEYPDAVKDNSPLSTEAARLMQEKPRTYAKANSNSDNFDPDVLESLLIAAASNLEKKELANKKPPSFSDYFGGHEDSGDASSDLSDDDRLIIKLANPNLTDEQIKKMGAKIAKNLSTAPDRLNKWK